MHTGRGNPSPFVGADAPARPPHPIFPLKKPGGRIPPVNQFHSIHAAKLKSPVKSWAVPADTLKIAGTSLYMAKYPSS